jgi:hypothetical protein
MIETQVESIVSKALSVGKANHAQYQVLPRIGVIDNPLEQNGWLFVPRDKDKTIIPHEAHRHIELLEESGVVILQQIVGHNLQEEEEKKKKQEEIKLRQERLTKTIEAAIGIVGFIVMGVLTLFFGLLQILLTADPALLVVLEDGTWLAVAEWDD